VLTNDEHVKNEWKDDFEKCLNEDYPREIVEDIS